MEQKFRKLTFVIVSDELPPEMSQYDRGFVGIVDGSYSQIFGGKDIKSYRLFKVENNKIVDNIAWYNETHLTELPKQDRKKAEEMIEEYNFKKITK